VFFVGTQIQNFAAVMLIGILAGTYSSLFIAPSLLVIWERGEWHRLVPLTRAGTAGK
ncbi:MAG: protein translocase subunit SecF, partial [Dehalococcoidales bacterium]